MNLIPSHRENLAENTSFSNDEVQSARIIHSNIQVRFNRLHKNLKFEIKENRKIEAKLIEENVVIKQIQLLAKKKELTTKKSIELRLQSHLFVLNNREKPILKEFKENEKRGQLLQKDEEWMKSLLKDLKMTQPLESYIEAVRYFQTLNTIEEFREFLKHTNNLPAKEQAIWKVILASEVPGIDALPVGFILTDENENPIGKEIAVELPLSIWKAHSEVFQNDCLSDDKDPFMCEVSEEGLDVFLECLTSCKRCDQLLTYENLEDVMNLARNFEVKWLVNECSKLKSAKML